MEEPMTTTDEPKPSSSDHAFAVAAKAVFALGAFIVIAIILWWPDRPERSQPTSSVVSEIQSAPVVSSSPVRAVEVPPAPLPQVDPDALYRAYHSNELAADRMYKGRRFSMEARIGRVEKDFSGSPYIVFGGDVRQIQANFPKTAEAALVNVERGQVVTVVCTGAGMTFDIPSLEDCFLR
jgi:hypothetical protein